MKYYLLICLLLSGCFTLPHTNCKSPETITLTITDRPTSKMKLSLVNEGIVIAKLVGKFILNNEAKQYEATYSSQCISPNIVSLTPIRKLDKRLILQRNYTNDVAVKWVLDIVPIIITNSTRGYCQIQPQYVDFNMSKAKMTGFLSPILKADRINIDITITLQFASAQFQNGLSQYVHTFTLKDVQVGKSIDLTRFVSPIYEVASDGPMLININVKESNRMAGWLRSIANTLK